MICLGWCIARWAPGHCGGYHPVNKLLHGDENMVGADAGYMRETQMDGVPKRSQSTMRATLRRFGYEKIKKVSVFEGCSDNLAVKSSARNGKCCVYFSSVECPIGQLQ